MGPYAVWTFSIAVGLFITVLTILKLIGYVNVSWIAVLFPLWLPVSICLTLVIISIVLKI